MAGEVAWGDVRMVEFGHPDKARPALVLTRGRMLDRLSAITVAPITRTIRGAPTEVKLGVSNGLKTESVANLDGLQTVSKDRLGRYLGSVGRDRKAEIRAALLFAMELDRE